MIKWCFHFFVENVFYEKEPSLAGTIYLSETNELKPITGIAVLGNKLFAITESSQKIGVYDSNTFQRERNMEVRGMTDPLDIASSKVAGWLYISYKGSNETESTILRLESNGQL